MPSSVLHWAIGNKPCKYHRQSEIVKDKATCNYFDMTFWRLRSLLGKIFWEFYLGDKNLGDTNRRIVVAQVC